MPKVKLVLKFPSSLINEPIVFRLVKDFDLMINILRASISPDEAGHAVIELDGSREAIEQGRQYLENCGIEVQSLAQDVRWCEERCTGCGACVSVCPTGALSLDRSTLQVGFDEDKCIGCELCIPVCAYRAMEIHV